MPITKANAALVITSLAIAKLLIPISSLVTGLRESSQESARFAARTPKS
jgi:hypothetical protein